MSVKQQLQQALALLQANQPGPARALLRQAIQAAPRLADAHHLLGMAEKADGNAALAVTHIGAAIAIAPRQPVFYNNLGNCYLERGELVAAQLCYRRAAELKPDYIDALSNLGLTLLKLGDRIEARLAIERTLQLKPDDEHALCNLGDCHMHDEQLEAALAVYEQVLARHPRSAVGHLRKSRCLHKLGRLAEALAVVEQAIALSPATLSEALHDQGLLLNALGRLDEACAAFDRALQVTPQAAHILFARAEARKVRADEPFFSLLQAQAPLLEQLPAEPRTLLGYALGKAYDDVGDMARAAASYAAGANAKLTQSDFDERHDIASAAQIQTVCSAPYLRELARSGNPATEPIIILGMPRSGTTLVEQILVSHPQVFGGGELPYAMQALNRQADGLHACGQYYVDQLRALPGYEGQRHITDKLPGNYLTLGLIASMLPNAKIVHCRRDPIDTAISCYTTLFGAGHFYTFDLAMLGRAYRRYWELMAHWRKVLPGRFVEVRYDQLTADTETQARRLLQGCGLEWDPQVLNFHQTQRSVQTASVTQVRQPIYGSSNGRWKKWEPYIAPLLAELADIEQAYWAELDGAA
jgi:tetratricopeptide (TPR) repeat protein